MQITEDLLQDWWTEQQSAVVIHLIAAFHFHLTRSSCLAPPMPTPQRGEKHG